MATSHCKKGRGYRRKAPVHFWWTASCLHPLSHLFPEWWPRLQGKRGSAVCCVPERQLGHQGPGKDSPAQDMVAA